MDIAELLAFAVKNNASDLHLSSGLPPMIRVDGDIRRLTLPALDTAQLQELLYSTMSDQQRRDYEANLEVDYSYSVQGLARFRVNCFHHDRGVGGAFRTIPDSVWTLEDIGAPPIFRDIIDAPRGLILMTGPTGSGKSTTLAAMIDHLNNIVEGHVLTIEDPIEFVHRSKKCVINQREVHRDTHGFNQALRAALREDPDIILVGEMRDIETIRLALTAAETGHLVFSTLHTNDAIGGVTRLLDMGVEPFLLSASVRAFLAQRLVRRLCPECKVTAAETNHDMSGAVGIPREVIAAAYEAKGCESCRGTGYFGRLAIFEVVPLSQKIQDIIVKGGGYAELEAQAKTEGFQGMRDYGWEKVIAGETTIAEVLSATSSDMN